MCVAAGALLWSIRTREPIREQNPAPDSSRLPDKPASRRDTPTAADNVAGDAFLDEPAFRPGATVEEWKREAVRTATELVAAFPDSAEALQVAARLQAHLGHTDAAVQLWRRAIELDADSADAYFQMALVAAKRGELEHAVEMFEKVLAIEPTHPEALARLADALMQAGKAPEAVQRLEKDLRGRPASDEVLLALGRAYLEMGRYEQAQKAFQTVIDAAPDKAGAYFGLARACARLGQAEQSRRWFQKYKDLASLDYEALARATRGYNDQRVVRDLLVDTLVAAGRVYAACDATEKAERVWRKAAVVAPGDARCRYQLLRLYEQQRRDRAALEVAEQLCRIEPEKPDCWLFVGVLRARLGRRDAGLTAIQKAMELDPQNAAYRQVYRQIKEGS